MKKLIQIITASILLGGCGYPKEILVSSSFTSEEEEILDECLDELEEALDVNLGISFIYGWQPVFEFSEDTFEGVDGKGTMFITEKGSYGYKDVAEKYNTDFEGYTRFYTKWSIVLVHQDDIEDLRASVLHELVHYIGHHGHVSSGLMGRSADEDNPCVDSLSLDSICKVISIDCGPNAHETCTQKGMVNMPEKVFQDD